MKALLGWVCIGALTALSVSLPASAAKKKSKSKTTSSSSKSRKAPIRKSTTKGASSSKTSSSKSGSSKSGSKKAVASKGGKKGTATRTTWRNRQLAPTPERYKEIQGALAAKGYLSPEDATGAWGQSSTDALKKFQADQRLDASGKINSLSLIALGLGPKREPAPGVKPPDTPAHEADR